MPYPEIPDEIRSELDRLRSEAAAAFTAERWAEAASLLDDSYNFLRREEENYARRFHKGWELHNAGIALLNTARRAEGVRKIFLAYVEDALSADPGQEDAIDGGPAGSVLKRLGTPLDLLRTIKGVAGRLKKEGTVVTVPDLILDSALQSVARTYATIAASLVRQAERESESRQARSIEHLDAPIEKRCFIGGNYFVGGPNLEEIRQAVVDQGFDAIVARDFDVDADMTHHRSLLLLHLCSKAIFEVSVPAGQLMELERCRDYDIRPFLLRQILPDADPLVSEMISSMAETKVHPYSTLDEMRRLIQEYLRG